jgi:transposase
LDEVHFKCGQYLTVLRDGHSGQAYRVLRQLLRQRGQPACDRLAAWLNCLECRGGILPATVHTMRQWQIELEGYLRTGLSNGRAEALNSNVALLRHLARHYTNQYNFAARIMSLNPAAHH